jgi:uncharacterized protein (DUF1697 family)
MEQVIALNPFPLPQDGEKVKLYVCFLSATPAIGAVESSEALSYPLEQVKVINSEVSVYKQLWHTTKFPNTLIEKELGVKSTVRN